MIVYPTMNSEEQKIYLNSKVYPTLMEGIYQTWQNQPDDPVKYLAEWLHQHNPLKPSVFDIKQ